VPQTHKGKIAGTRLCLFVSGDDDDYDDDDDHDDNCWYQNVVKTDVMRVIVRT
jgi:hypothetical protein